MLYIIIEKEDFEVNCLYKTRWDSYLGIAIGEEKNHIFSNFRGCARRVMNSFLIRVA
jgi:hypothetical protein